MGPTLFANANYEFFGKRWIFVGISTTFLLVGLISYFVQGLNFGVEFTGGAQIEANFNESKQTKVEVKIETVRDALDKVGLQGIQVVTVGAAKEHSFLIRAQTLTKGGEGLGDKLKTLFVTKFGEDKVSYFSFYKETRDSANVRIEDPSGTPDAVKQLIESAPELGGLRVDEVRADKSSGMLTIVRTMCSIVTICVAWRIALPGRCLSSGERKSVSVPQSIAARATRRTAKRSITGQG